MIVPGVSAVVLPPLVGFVLGREALGGFLAGATLVGVFLALMMANAGGAWDNAKKHIEAGHLGGQGRRRAPGRGGRRHRGRSLQGHRGPIHEHSDQADVGGGTGDRATVAMSEAPHCWGGVVMVYSFRLSTRSKVSGNREGGTA
jgi:Inorganic H+ pyrophosphatase